MYNNPRRTIGAIAFAALVVAAAVDAFSTPAENVLVINGQVESTKWTDELIYKSIVQSMKEWKRNRMVRNRMISSTRPKRAVTDDDFDSQEYTETLPDSSDQVNTRFLVYNSRKRQRPVFDLAFLNLTSDGWQRAVKAFNVSMPTKFIIHGFGSACSNRWAKEMISAIMTAVDSNVVCVDWKDGARPPNYVRAAANTQLVGKQVATFIKGLVTRAKLSVENVHLIGFSLGAHVAGFAGAELKNLSRITGLDPAGPMFQDQTPRARLDPTDAKFVDVIHTNGENLLKGGLGIQKPVGHVDYYPNGGRVQNGCSNLFIAAVATIFLYTVTDNPDSYEYSLCNHRRALKFFTNSMSPDCAFPAVPCESYEKFQAGECTLSKDKSQPGNMGYYSDKSPARGKMYLTTRDDDPFCGHQYTVKIYNTPDELSTVTHGQIQIVLFDQFGKNETFTITNDVDAELTRGTTTNKVIVPHLSWRSIKKVQFTYTLYRGWVTSGLLTWSIDKLILTDSYGNSQSVCQKDLVVQSKVPVMLPLYPGNCSLPELAPKPINVGGIRNKTDQSPKYGHQHVNDSLDIKENTIMLLKPVQADAVVELTGNSLDPLSDRRENAGRAFSWAGRKGHGSSNITAAIRPMKPASPLEDDQSPYRTVKSNGTASVKNNGLIRDPVPRPEDKHFSYDNGTVNSNRTVVVKSNGTGFVKSNRTSPITSNRTLAVKSNGMPAISDMRELVTWPEDDEWVVKNNDTSEVDKIIRDRVPWSEDEYFPYDDGTVKSNRSVVIKSRVGPVKSNGTSLVTSNRTLAVKNNGMPAINDMRESVTWPEFPNNDGAIKSKVTVVIGDTHETMARPEDDEFPYNDEVVEVMSNGTKKVNSNGMTAIKSNGTVKIDEIREPVPKSEHDHSSNDDGMVKTNRMILVKSNGNGPVMSSNWTELVKNNGTVAIGDIHESVMWPENDEFPYNDEVFKSIQSEGIMSNGTAADDVIRKPVSWSEDDEFLYREAAMKNKGTAAVSKIGDLMSWSENDEFPYDDGAEKGSGAEAVKNDGTETVKNDGTETVKNAGTAAVGKIREPMLRSKNRILTFLLPTGLQQVLPPSPANGNSTSFIARLMPQKVMDVIERVSPYIWNAKERVKRALKFIPSLFFNEKTSKSVEITKQQQPSIRQLHAVQLVETSMVTDSSPAEQEDLSKKDI